MVEELKSRALLTGTSTEHAGTCSRHYVAKTVENAWGPAAFVVVCVNKNCSACDVRPLANFITAKGGHSMWGCLDMRSLGFADLDSLGRLVRVQGGQSTGHQVLLGGTRSGTWT